MHFACRYRGSHNAVKLLRPQFVWHIHHARLIRPYATHNEGFDLPAGHHLEGSYTPRAQPNGRAQNIAVLGGGISGLTTAFNLSRDLPDAKITVFEAQDQPGGWVDSERVDVNDGKVVFEWGPRTLRPDTMGNGLATLRLIHQLEQKDKKVSIIGTSSSDPAATNRYIYYPDHLVRMPSPSRYGLIASFFNIVRSILTEPIFKGTLWKLFAEASVETRAENMRDESVGDFISRRYGDAVADNLLSALFHGIYAGNIYNLSARTLLPKLWYLETRDSDGNGVNTEMMELMFKQQLLLSWDTIRNANRTSIDDAALENRNDFHQFVEEMRKCSVYTFINGIAELKLRFLENLLANENVGIETGATISEIMFDSSNRKFTITCKDGYTAENFDYAVSRLPPKTMANALSTTESSKTQHRNLISSLSRSPSSVNVMVVNLYYTSESLPIPQGFGYLIPRSISASQNLERALGVIFGSETAGLKGHYVVSEQTLTIDPADQDSANIAKKVADAARGEGELEAVEEQLGQDTASGTKLGVMLGGHWWDGWSESDLSSEAEAIEMAKTVIARHLGVTEEPYAAKAKLQRDCIPQYQVGYRDDMARIHEDLMRDFGGRLKVTGPWWQGGVGLNDCVMGAREISRGIREAWDDETGLEKYVGEEKWYIRDHRSGVCVRDPLGKK